MSRLESPIGRTGRVSRQGAIRPGRTGEVMIAMDGGVQAFLARDADGGAIDALAEVVVVDRVAERTLLVTPVYDASPHPQLPEENQS
jgi:hypothetical protein